MRYRIVPDVLRYREPVRKGREPKNETSKALLEGKTLFIQEVKNFGSLYNLARSRGMKARTQKILLNGESGTLVWFEEDNNEIYKDFVDGAKRK